MNKKTEESRIAYNKIASEYDMSREGQYTRFHIMELSNTVDLSAVMSFLMLHVETELC